MPLQTNYSILSASAPGIAAQVIRFIGNPAIYGYETPINISDLLNDLNTQVALSAIPYCTVPTVVIGQNLGISMVEQLLYIWSDIFSGDTTLARFLYNMGQFVNANVTSPDRIDYCGKDLGGSQLFTLAQLNDELAGIMTMVNALDLAAEPQTYYTMMIQPTSVPLTPAQTAAIVPGTTKVTFPEDVTVGITGVNGVYILYPIATAIQMDQYVQNTFTYSSNTEDFYQVSYNPAALANAAGGGPTPTAYNNRNQSVVWLAQAAQAAYNQLIEGTNAYVTSVYGFLLSAISDYEASQLAPLIQVFSSVNQAATGGFNPPSTQTGVPAIDAAGQEIINAGLALRTQLLRNPLYVITFDKDSDGIINVTERIAMEVDVLHRMEKARAAFITSFLESFSAQLFASNGIPSSLPTSILDAVS